MKEFSADGVSFSYPDNWTLEREEADDGWAVTVQSPGTAFALVRLDSSLPDPAEVVHATLDAMRAEYPDLEAESALELMGGEMAVGHDMEFFSLDLSNTAWTRAIYATAGTLLILCQVTDREAEEYEPAMRALCQSLRVEVD